MTLDNLVDVSLERIEPDRVSVQRLLEAAERSLNDAQISGLSSEGRFDLAYKAIMQTANAALQANGYRTLTSRPGHHGMMIQSLPKTIGLESQKMMLLDKLRRQRNDIDYSGDVVSEGMAKSCIAEADSLLQRVKGWIAQHRVEWRDERS
jgi:uncharacterized protein (UPF0332 family)